MLRVTKAEEHSHTLITIDGQLSGDSIEVVETCCSQAGSSGKPVHLFLHDVSTVDVAGLTLLRRLVAKGVRLLARGVYTSYIVQEISLPGTTSRESTIEDRGLGNESRRGNREFPAEL